VGIVFLSENKIRLAAPWGGISNFIIAILTIICYDVIVPVNDNIIADYAFVVKTLCYTGKAHE
jgi:hypothetical protein